MSSEEEPLALSLTDDELVVQTRRRRVVGSVIAATVGVVGCACLHSQRTGVEHLESITAVETCTDGGVVASCPLGEETSIVSLGDWTVCGSNAILPTQEVVFVGGVEQCKKECIENAACRGIQWVQGADVSADICIQVHEDICEHVTIERPQATASSPAPQDAACMIKKCGTPSLCTDGQEECCPLCRKEQHETPIVDKIVRDVLVPGGADLPENMEGIFWKVSEFDSVPPVVGFPDIISFGLNTDGCGRNLGKIVDGDTKVNLCGDRTVAFLPKGAALPLREKNAMDWIRSTCECNMVFTNVAGRGTVSEPLAYRLAIECGSADLGADVADFVRSFNDNQHIMRIMDTMNFVQSTFGVSAAGTTNCGGRDWGCAVLNDVNAPAAPPVCDAACYADPTNAGCVKPCILDCADAITNANAPNGGWYEGCVICGNTAADAANVPCVDCTANPFNARCVFCAANPGRAECAGIDRKVVQTGCVGWEIANNAGDSATLLQAFGEDGVANTGCGARELFDQYGRRSWLTFTNTKECLLN